LCLGWQYTAKQNRLQVAVCAWQGCIDAQQTKEKMLYAVIRLNRDIRISSTQFDSMWVDTRVKQTSCLLGSGV